MKWMNFKPLDYAAFLFALFTIGLFSYFAYATPGKERLVYIQSVDNEWVFPLEEERTLEIEGPIGSTEVHIHDGSVSVISSPCKEQICVSSGRISNPGTWIACLPNRVFVRIEAKKEDTIDASAY